MPPATPNSRFSLNGRPSSALTCPAAVSARARTAASGSWSGGGTAAAGGSNRERAVVYDSPVLAMRPRTSLLKFFWRGTSGPHSTTARPTPQQRDQRSSETKPYQPNDTGPGVLPPLPLAGSAGVSLMGFGAGPPPD